MPHRKERETIVLMDYAAISQLTGIDAAVLRLYASRGKLPKPDYKVSQSPGWLPETIEAWMSTFENGRVPSRKRAS